MVGERMARGFLPGTTRSARHGRPGWRSPGRKRVPVAIVGASGVLALTALFPLPAQEAERQRIAYVDRPRNELVLSAGGALEPYPYGGPRDEDPGDRLSFWTSGSLEFWGNTSVWMELRLSGYSGLGVRSTFEFDGLSVGASRRWSLGDIELSCALSGGLAPGSPAWVCGTLGATAFRDPAALSAGLWMAVDPEEPEDFGYGVSLGITEALNGTVSTSFSVSADFASDTAARLMAKAGIAWGSERLDFRMDASSPLGRPLEASSLELSATLRVPFLRAPAQRRKREPRTEGEESGEGPALPGPGPGPGDSGAPEYTPRP